MLNTIGYEGVSQTDFVSTLAETGVTLVIDIRDRAQSRRPGFSKSSLDAALAEAGIGYTHLRALGDPKEGRDAARAGNFRLFEYIYKKVLETEEAAACIDIIIEKMQNADVCLLCYERDYRYCHRRLVSDKIESLVGVKAKHLGVRQFEHVKAIA
ncbi:MAG: DUF488 domain-containing protein [Asticcacaulis sp.]|nr:DUF488 domain-containing protein [Asticcacaulis sp.]